MCLDLGIFVARDFAKIVGVRGLKGVKRDYFRVFVAESHKKRDAPDRQPRNPRRPAVPHYEEFEVIPAKVTTEYAKNSG